jgi:hypothetical protein
MDGENTVTIKRATFDFSKIQVVKNNHGSARGEMFDKFLEKLNPGREEVGLRPYSHARLSKMLEHLSTSELYPFYRDCLRAKTFSAYFHWALKPESKKRLAPLTYGKTESPH